MSSDTALMPDDPQMVKEPSDRTNYQTRGEAPAARDAFSVEPTYDGGKGSQGDWPEFNVPEEQPLNAEEATLLVLYFLERMRKKVITPRSAVLNDDDIFVVEVDLKGAKATVHIHAKTREISEYTIQPVVKEPKPLPIPPRRIALILGAVVATVIFVMLFNFFKLYAAYIIENVSTDYMIIGGAILLIVAGIIWWRRR